MKTNFFLLIGLMPIFLTACVQMNPIGNTWHNPRHHSASFEVEPSSNEAIAKYHEYLAKEIQVKLQEQKNLLKEYEDRSYFYGAKGQDLRSHTSANIRYYENLVEENLRKAAIHYRLANEQKERDTAADTSESPTLSTDIGDWEHEFSVSPKNMP
ncbi:hypothetical protein SAMN05421880_102172 [Nitrosomonas nitrosa]|jgi:hypothetical protein|uniref:DUF4398 domain-containing protein n=1 Tax=Nitrosomonas nitrosa TaxID=52442 RepID=A0A1I4LQQ3_9PROT|nr:hypothetical protein [Nitrosomonas nitrosa]SFL93352.1 hypothetical protein SAMN05421880_102172 [Nitrosomonas nitrosa]